MQLLWKLRRGGARLLGVSLTAAALLSGAALEANNAAGARSAFTLPDGPAKPGFDITRLNSSVYGSFETFHVSETRLLRDALKSHVVANDTDLLVTETAGGSLALIVEQMAYHHIAQGRTNGRDWLVSFCVVCNTGTRLVPTTNGKAVRFETAGVYDGMMVMRDAASGTLWNHITGEALYGPGVGTSLGPVGNVLQMTAKQLFAAAPDARLAVSDRIYFAGGRRLGTLEGISLLGRTHSRPDPRAALSSAFVATLGREDARRPRMDLGLGIWSGSSSRFYPLDFLRRKPSVFIDRLDGRTVVVYLDPQTSTPAALFVDSTRARLDGSVVRLDNGLTVRNGILKNARGERMTMERPLQLFTRWYGFALTFPGTDVFAAD